MNKALKIALPILAVIVGIVVSVMLYLTRPEAEHRELNIKAPMVTVTTVQSESQSIPVYTRGTVTPGTEIQLISEVSGQVLELSPNFANGGFFRKGDVLIRVDPIEYEVNLKRAEASKAQAYQAMLTAEAEKKARSGVRGNSSRLGTYEVQYQQARAHYEAAIAELDAVKMQRDRTVIRAPFDGRVRIAALNVGQYLRPGQQMGAIYAVDVAEVRLPLSDRQLGLVDVPKGFRLDGADQAFPEVTLTEKFAGRAYTWKGKVVRAEGGVDERNRLLYVVAQVVDPYAADPNQPGRPELVAGSFVEATIEGRRFDQVFEVPRKALRNGQELWVVDKDNKLREREVSIIYKGKDYIYISSGLDNGDRVVLSQMDIAVDGMQVRTKSVDQFELEPEPQELDDNLFGAADSSQPEPGQLSVEEKARQIREQYESRQAVQEEADGADTQADSDMKQLSVEPVVVDQPIQADSAAVESADEPQDPPAASSPAMSSLAEQIDADIAAQEQQDAPDAVVPSGQSQSASSNGAASSISISVVSAPKPLVESVK